MCDGEARARCLTFIVTEGLEKILTDERRKIDGLLTSDEIRTIRLSLGFTQVDVAKTIGVGEKNFAGYENGQATQGRSREYISDLIRRAGHEPVILPAINFTKAVAVAERPPGVCIKRRERVMKKIPKFKTESEERTFWEENDSSDFLEVFFTFAIRGVIGGVIGVRP